MKCEIQKKEALSSTRVQILRLPHSLSSAGTEKTPQGFELLQRAAMAEAHQ
jgi:hypothetical protein